MSRHRAHLTGSADGSITARYGHRGVKLVQRGVVTVTGVNATGTATVTAVNVGNAVLTFTGYTNTDGTTMGADNPTDYCFNLTLTNSTTVTATRTGTVNLSNHTIAFELIEYWPGVLRSVTYGVVNITAASSGTATVSINDITRASVQYLGFSTNATTASRVGATFPTLAITNATTITATLSANPATAAVQYCLVEYWP